MAVRKEKWGWIVDFVFTHPDGSQERVRQKSPVQTRRGAEEYERQKRHEMLYPQPSRKEVPTLDDFAEEFIEQGGSKQNARCKPGVSKGKN